MESSWASKPLPSNSNRLRTATAGTSLLSAVLAFFCIIYFSSAGWDELHWAAHHPAGTVFFLTWLYYIHFLNAVFIFVCSIMCLIGMWYSPHGVPGTCTWPGLGRVSTILVLSRALRVTFWTAFCTICVVFLVGQDTCRNIDAPGEAAQKSHFCDCIEASEATTPGTRDDVRREQHLTNLQQMCRPKTFHTCLQREDAQSAGILSNLFGNHTVCGYACLHADSRHVYDRTECDALRCLSLDDSLGCYWGEYECPARLEDFNDVYLEHKFRYCTYDPAGDLTSTNFSPVTPTRTDLDEEIHSELHDVTVDLEDSRVGSNGASMTEVLSQAGMIEEGAVCIFVDGDGSCAERNSCTEKMLSGFVEGRYVGPTVGGIYPRSDPDPRAGIWSEQACAEFVMETEPSANGATYSAGPKNSAVERPACYAEFNSDHTVLPNHGSATWRTCFLTPTDDFFLTLIPFVGGTNATIIPAQCRLEWTRAQMRIDEEVTICNAVVDGALFMVCILLLLTTYWFSRTQYNYYLTIDPDSVAMLAGGSGGEGAHVQLEDVGNIGGSSDPSGEVTETAHDARP
eukprot:COSAG02_NODE_256_length_26885_cov_54.604308_10_plen_569_part_00